MILPLWPTQLRVKKKHFRKHIIKIIMSVGTPICYRQEIPGLKINLNLYKLFN